MAFEFALAAAFRARSIVKTSPARDRMLELMGLILAPIFCFYCFEGAALTRTSEYK
jgi:hypothetical protein